MTVIRAAVNTYWDREEPGNGRANGAVQAVTVSRVHVTASLASAVLRQSKLCTRRNLEQGKADKRSRAVIEARDNSLVPYSGPNSLLQLDDQRRLRNRLRVERVFP